MHREESNPKQQNIKCRDASTISMTGNGRVEPKTARDCLPKSRHSLQIGIKNFADIVWPVG